MGLQHKTRNVHGVQFHPESIASEHGHAILKNFLDLGEGAADGRPANPCIAKVAAGNAADARRSRARPST